ncbi:hypothetical protein SAMN05421858_4096 [Haladaptatus litoreus]|uniref:Uncharacterized protein n=1 Tax=Haladaptatus litoreus TaxID=553468 RepID=A0A1N7E839_9EURY|nr:hypothetical protein [Haladaptatus litoreus]SIR84115.1 hypothetical protein SAMN05421858_4096 [Haladaptatus litoreus]
MSGRRSGSNQINKLNHETIIICVVLLSVLAVSVVFGAMVGTNVASSTVQSGPPAGDFAPIEDTADACVPDEGDTVLWHLERYGTGCPEQTGGSPVGKRTNGIDSSP